MKEATLYFVAVAFMLSGCSKPEEVYTLPAAVAVDSAGVESVLAEVIPVVQESTDTTEVFEEMQDYYIIVADEGYDYDALQKKGLEVADLLKVNFDQKGRIYESGKGIIVPYDDKDEVYRGEYYPRRFEGEEISIEMHDYYALEDAPTDTTRMILVAGMYETPEKAQIVLQKLKPFVPGAELMEREMYIGCLH